MEKKEKPTIRFAHHAPVPDYWCGNATTVMNHVPGLKPASIAKYLTRCNLYKTDVKA